VQDKGFLEARFHEIETGNLPDESSS
jgi:hypothetical protein